MRNFDERLAIETTALKEAPHSGDFQFSYCIINIKYILLVYRCSIAQGQTALWY